jgi:stearoyl-CoA desaturase (delta-9 desaturase)
MMWHARQVSNRIFKMRIVIEPRFLKNLPDWRTLDIAAHTNWSRVAWIAVYVIVYLIFAPSAWWFLLLPIHILMVPLQGAIINWFAHKYGGVNFKMKNTSTNLFRLDLFMMGEAYHNNHHKNPSSTNFGFRWYELDPTYVIMRFFNWLKIIRIHKVVAQPLILHVSSDAVRHNL